MEALIDQWWVDDGKPDYMVVFLGISGHAKASANDLITVKVVSHYDMGGEIPDVSGRTIAGPGCIGYIKCSRHNGAFDTDLDIEVKLWAGNEQGFMVMCYKPEDKEGAFKRLSKRVRKGNLPTAGINQGGRGLE